MVRGKVVRFDDMRGYGFVAPDGGGEDVFMHVNDLDVDKRLITPGVVVEFTVEDGERGLKASDIRLVREAGDVEDPGSARDFREELTEALLTGAPTLTADEVLRVRRVVLELVRDHGWLDA